MSEMQGNKIVVDPITRIEGHLRIEVEVEGGKIKNAWSMSTLFRGLEMILKGRDPRDAQHFTQRACGVCTYVHALASVRAVDNCVGVKIPENATLMRNLTMGAQYMHDHLVHFYHLHALDWVNVANALNADPAKAARLANDLSPRKTTTESLKAVQAKVKALVESGQLGIFTNAYFLGGHPAYVLPAEVDLIATAHYLEALRVQVKAARAMAIFGAKNPHTQFTVVGGCTNYDSLRPERIAEFRKLYKEVREFIEQVYITDLLAVAGFYKNWAGIGKTSNFLTCGEFPTDEYDLNSRYTPQGVIWGNDLSKVDDFNPDLIEEHVKYSWYEGADAHHPYKGVTKPKWTEFHGEDRYSWMKAPRYKGEAFEVGPLASVLVAYAKKHEPTVKAVDLVLKTLGVGPEALFSTLGRTAARGIQCLTAAQEVEVWLDKLEANVKAGKDDLYTDWQYPTESQGVGFVNAPRGMLSHWIVQRGGKIENFQLVVPSTWNLGPRCAEGKLSAVEQALIGTPIADPKRPVEILRTVHSYDPCIACGVHVIDPESNQVHKFRIL
ncbi:nickel-dependent hydrogenase large subunit [Megalodesulfovibrio gigas]|uniref:Periplasmic [NiFe] hydrogenase large subunit n=2 Tax=Megalodesulfovibrio gigas TaxID=879 RepID=T2GD14_MEGG1|nr:nickel-dependent hydrogenase large subunit [Megalodesulfovibrio gigas]AGW14016.1 NiFe hydrogenase large subunit [Megalodesulfovibrio gigas DSM 1382 = ATCC 19364]